MHIHYFASFKNNLNKKVMHRTTSFITFLSFTAAPFLQNCPKRSPEVHDHLHSFERVKLQVVKTAPDSQLLNLLSVSRLITVLNEADQCGVVCTLQELDRGVFGCAVVGVQREEQWGENTALRSSSADRAGAGWDLSQPHYLLSVCQEAGDPLTDGGGDGQLCQFILKGVLDDGVKSGAEIYKQDPHISPWSVQMLQDEVQSHVDCIIHRPVCSVDKLQGVRKGPMEAFR